MKGEKFILYIKIAVSITRKLIINKDIEKLQQNKIMCSVYVEENLHNKFH